MSLQTTINDQLLTALKAGDNQTRDILRLLKSALQNSAIELNRTELTDEEVLGVIAKEVKKRKESILAYTQANKPELVKAEQAEMSILEKYLPAQMSEEDILAHIKTYLAAHPTTITQMGQAMGALSAELKGQADMGQVSQLLRRELGQ